MNKGGAFKAVSMMMIITLLGKALGLLRDSFVGSYYGTASIEGAAFNYASVLPRSFMDVMFASAISASFIPVFKEALEREGQERAFRLGHHFISVILTLSAAVTLVCILLAHPIVAWYDGGQNPAAIDLAARLIRIMFPIIIITCLAFSLTGILQSMGEFNIPAAMGLAANSVIIIYFFLGMKTFGVTGLCAAYLLGWAAQFFIQIPFLWRRNFRYRFTIHGKDEGMKKIGRLMLPVMVSTWVAPVNALVNGKAALLDPTGIEAFNAIVYANTLYSVITGVFVLSVSNVIFPRLSVLAAQDDEAGFSRTMRQTIRVLFFFLIPMTLGLMALSRPLVRLVYERNQFTSLSTTLTSTAMIFFCAGIPGFGLQTILTRGFYARQQGKTPMITGLIAIAVNLMLSYTLVPWLGVGGPALANSIAITLISLVMLLRMKGIVSLAFFRDLFKMLAAGLLMLAAVLFTREWMTGKLADTVLNRMLILGLTVMIGLILYIGASALLRIPEMNILTDMIKKAAEKREKAKNGA
jgi:putative peptidoglycan lipid II flippase